MKNPGLLLREEGEKEMVKAKIIVRYKPGILDPEGKTINNALKSLGFEGIEEVHTGKYFELSFGLGIDVNKAKEVTKNACDRLLANPVIQSYEFEVVEEEK